jgi:hypothetical protein
LNKRTDFISRKQGEKQRIYRFSFRKLQIFLLSIQAKKMWKGKVKVEEAGQRGTYSEGR